MALTKFSLASFPLVDLPSSSAVHGIVTEDGLFDGHISTPEEHYYIEPASRYFSSLEDDVKQPFHSVIYKASDVIHPNLDEDGEVSVLQCIHNWNWIWKVQCCQLCVLIVWLVEKWIYLFRHFSIKERRPYHICIRFSFYIPLEIEFMTFIHWKRAFITKRTVPQLKGWLVILIIVSINGRYHGIEGDLFFEIDSHE